jgi:hypothetical protein
MAVRSGTYFDRAEPPGELALVDQDGYPGGTDAVVKQVAGGAAGRDILHPADVVPGAAFRAVAS